jgi:rare lipoprotein A
MNQLLNTRSVLLFFFLITSIQAFSQQTEKGIASYYHDKLEGRATASGEPYKAEAMTAAHPSLPFNTKLKVTNLDNGLSVVVRVNDRGPFVKGRIIDLSKAAARELDFLDKGVARVEIEIMKKP